MCLATKVIHFEVVISFKVKAFVAALRRFGGGRGGGGGGHNVCNIFSDNGVNFVGAGKIIAQLHLEEEV